MIWIILIFLLLILIFSVFFRTIILNPHLTLYYGPVDLYKYFRYRLFNNMETGKLICYTALFGGGKTLSCVHYINQLYRRYNNKKVFDFNSKKWLTQKVMIISNVDLSIPYIHFESLQQVINFANNQKEIDKQNGTLTNLIVFGDEFSVQMNSREFKTNIDPLFLNTLLTCRHHHIMLVYNAQRFQHVDKLLRGVTNYVIECKKIWRVCIQKTYDAWVIENCSDPTIVKPLARRGWFIRDKDFNAYDTLACVGMLIKSVQSGDMISEDEILNNIGENDINVNSVNEQKRALKALKRKL